MTKRAQSDPPPTEATGEETDDERSAFERFESFTRRLLSIPKDAIDAARTEREREQ